MKAYNTPNDTLTIKSDEGEELVKITPEKTTISNLEGGALPPVTPENAGAFLRVDSEGEIGAEQYPITTNTTTVYDDTVTVTEGGVAVNITTTYSGTDDDFKELTVVVNDETIPYDNYYEGFHNQDYSIIVTKDGSTLKLLAGTAGDYTVSIVNITRTVDEDFAEAVIIAVGSSLIVKYDHKEEYSYVLDKTGQEVMNAFNSGRAIYFKDAIDNIVPIGVATDDTYAYIHFLPNTAKNENDNYLTGYLYAPANSDEWAYPD